MEMLRLPESFLIDIGLQYGTRIALYIGVVIG